MNRKLFEKYKQCVCGRPYYYLESLKDCPGCGRRLIFFGDLVNDAILDDLEYYQEHPWATGRVGILTYDMSMPEKIISVVQFGEEDIKSLFNRQEEIKHLQDIFDFIHFFRKEFNQKNQTVQKKINTDNLSEKNPFERLIKEMVNSSQYDTSYEVDSNFIINSIREIPIEQLVTKLQNAPNGEFKIKRLKYLYNHTPEEASEHFGVTVARINQMTRTIFLILFKDTETIQTYLKKLKELDERHKKADQKVSEAMDRYNQWLRDQASKVNK